MPTLAHSSQFLCQPMGKSNGHWHQFGGLVTSKTKHQALIPCTLFCKQPFPLTDPLGDIGRLLVNRSQNRAGFIIKANGRIIISDFLNGLPDNCWQIGIGGGGNLSGNDRHSSRNQCFTGDPGFRILSQDCIKNSIRNLISNFIRVSFPYGF